jgi:hypothetical protein
MPAFRRRALALTCFVGIAAGLWFWLGRLERIDWLVVEGPPHAVVEELVTLRVHVTQLEAEAMLSVDLHWASDRNTPMGFLAAGEPRAVGKTGATFDFTIPVPARDNLHFVNGIIYLSPDGDWNNQTFAATTDLIPMTTARTPTVQATGLVRLSVRQLAEGTTRIATPKASLLRWATGLAWLLCVAVLGRQLWLARESSRPARGVSHLDLGFAVGFALAGIWELAGFETTLGNWARSLARAEDVFYPRVIFQKAIISVAVAAGIAWLGFGGRRHAFPLWLRSFGLYLAIAIVNLFSLHAIDQYATASWHGLTLVDALKCSCAGIALSSLYAQGRNLKLTANRSETPPG